MDEGAPKRGRGRGRGRGGRGRGRGRGRGKKAIKIIESDEEVDNTQVQETIEEVPQNDESVENSAPKIDLEADISQLEPPTFTTINRGPPEPMLRLDWSHKVNLIGEKVLNPMIHCCDKCLKPILIYGRMIPCKHVFCLTCGKQEQKQCPRCLEKVSRVEQTGLGTVFMCTHGGTRYGTSGCRRTYLSQRDLQAHINHRHVTTPTSSTSSTTTTTSTSLSTTTATIQPIDVQQQIEPEQRLPLRSKTNDPRSNIQISSNLRPRPNQIQSSGVRTNLITVPIQDSAPTVHETNTGPPPPPPPSHPYYNQYPPQSATYNQTLPPMHIPPPPPPQQPQYYAAPPAYSPVQTYQAYSGSAAPTPPPYGAQTGPTRTAQYDYSSAPPPPPPQWANNQPYYR